MTWLFRSVVCAALLACPADDAFADCNLPRSGRIALERSDIAFRGRAREIRLVLAANGSWIGTVATFDVSGVWKGNVGPAFVLHNANQSAEDVRFEKGLEYLVFATKNPPPNAARFGLIGTSFEARGCGGTVSMLEAARYLIDLGAGHPPLTQSRIPDPRTLR